MNEKIGRFQYTTVSCRCDIPVYLSFLIMTALFSCTGVPDNVTPIRNFDAGKYLGTWYEIARLDNSFEECLDSVTATYALRTDNGFSVTNRGYCTSSGKWKDITGKAYSVDRPDVGHLKVSFWGPFCTSYIIFDIDEPDYRYAFVSGSKLSYVWLLSRTPRISPEVKDLFLQRMIELGVDTDRLVWVKQ